MSRLVPIMLRDMMRPFRRMENEMRALEEDFFRPASFFNRPRYFLKYPDQEDAAVTQDRDKFQVKIDVEAFKPEEIKIRTLSDANTIEIEAKHEEKQDDHGFISRHFVRRFVLPKGHDLKSVVSNLSEDGVLTVTAPRKRQEIAQEKTIPIEHIEGKKES
uniref:Heat shock protein 18.8 n=1 Tax=Sitophilus oryzae TaxID=7048 RepID=A0A7S4ZD05_SITOR|nr:heat shock protein 18.8 [Sitophilus oryzae]